MDAEVFSYIYHHVILPPKLPNEPERKEKSLQREFMNLLKEALNEFVKARPPEVQTKWKPILNMIDTLLNVDAGGIDLNRNQDALFRALKALKPEGKTRQLTLDIIANG